MENVIIGTNSNFKGLIASEKITVVDFWAPWCGPCKTLGPILDTVAQENPDVQVVKVDVDENSDLSVEYGIRSIPTVFIFKSGELVNKFVGVKSKEEITTLIS
jgi:thioredoxin 1